MVNFRDSEFKAGDKVMIQFRDAPSAREAVIQRVHFSYIMVKWTDEDSTAVTIFGLQLKAVTRVD